MEEKVKRGKEGDREIAEHTPPVVSVSIINEAKFIEEGKNDKVKSELLSPGLYSASLCFDRTEENISSVCPPYNAL